MVIAECYCKHFPEAGLAPATHRLEVCRATIAPHGTIPCIFGGEKVTKFTLNLILTKTQKCPTLKLMKASACLCLNQDTNMHSPCLCLKQDTGMHSPSSTWMWWITIMNYESWHKQSTLLINEAVCFALKSRQRYVGWLEAQGSRT
jgi:hypothetical protein